VTSLVTDFSKETVTPDVYAGACRAAHRRDDPALVVTGEEEDGHMSGAVSPFQNYLRRFGSGGLVKGLHRGRKRQ